MRQARVGQETIPHSTLGWLGRTVRARRSPGWRRGDPLRQADGRSPLRSCLSPQAGAHHPAPVGIRFRVFVVPKDTGPTWCWTRPGHQVQLPERNATGRATWGKRPSLFARSAKAPAAAGENPDPSPTAGEGTAAPAFDERRSCGMSVIGPGRSAPVATAPPRPGCAVVPLSRKSSSGRREGGALPCHHCHAGETATEADLRSS